MCSAALCRARGQVAPPGAAGAPASASRSAGGERVPLPDPFSRRFFFCAFNQRPNPLISSNCAAAGSWLGSGAPCYPLPGAVTMGVTAKSLLLQGLRGLLPCYLLRGPLYAYAGGRACGSIYPSLSSNIGNICVFYSLSEAYPLRGLLPARLGTGNAVTTRRAARVGASDANLIGGGYSGGDVEGPGQRLDAGRARRNFRGRRAWRPIEAAGGLVGGFAQAGELRIQRERRAEAGNGGFPPFLGASAGAVGMAALEWSAQGLGNAALSSPRQKLRRLARRALVGLALADRAGGGAPPPSRAPSPFACRRSRFSGFGSAFGRLLNLSDRRGVRERALSPGTAMGSGVSGCQHREKAAGAGGARRGEGMRVGDRAFPVALTMSKIGLAARLWGGRGHVNA